MLAHQPCRDLACRCDCHTIGRASTPQGIHTLWDADQATAGYIGRRDWIITRDGITASNEPEKKTA